MKSKKLVAAVCLTVLLVSLLAGCGNNVREDLVGKWCMMTVDYEVVDFMGFELQQFGWSRSWSEKC